MPTQIIDKIENVAPNKTAYIKVEERGLFRMITIRFKNNGTSPNRAAMEALIHGVRIVVNGQDQREYVELADLHNFTERRNRQYVFEDGKITIFFSEPGLPNILQGNGLGWGTKRVSTFVIEMDLDDTCVDPEIEAELLFDNAEVEMGDIIRYHPLNVAPTAIGNMQITDLERETEDIYLGLHIIDGGNVFTKAKFEVGNATVYEVPSRAAANAVSDAGVFKTIPNMFSIELDPRSQLVGQSTKVVKDGTTRYAHKMPLTLYAAVAGGNHTLYREVLGRAV